MLKSMMQPPESKLSSSEIFVLILMPVLLIGYGSKAYGMRTFETLTWTSRTKDHKDRKMNQRFHKASVAPLLSSQLNILYDLEGGNLSYYTNARTHKQ